MSLAHPTSYASDGEAAATVAPSLTELRAHLDRLDDGLHDLLLRRAEVVARMAALGVKGPIAFRPGREADILRRLSGRHQGALPVRLLTRLWREIFAASTGVQGPFLIAVCETAVTSPAAQFVQCAREHFGALTPLRVHPSPAQALADISAGTATAAVLPIPMEDEAPAAAWWTALLHRDDPRIHIVAKLPFWAPRTEGAPWVRAMVVAAAPPDRSALDRSLIGLELPAEMSRARLATLLAAAGFAQGATILRRDSRAKAAFALVEVDGYVTDDDARLTALVDLPRPAVVLGAYAVPLEGETA